MDRNKIIDFYSQYSQQFEDKIASLDIYNNSYTEFIVKSKRKTNLLDLACGPGNVSAFIKNMLPDIEITCVDLSEKMLELAKRKLTDAKFYISDILKINIPDKKYDLIVCAFGIPYIKSSDLNNFAEQINKYSDPGTSVYISCMEGLEIDNETMSFADNHSVTVQRHQKDNIVNSFEKHNFKLTDFKTQEYIEPDGSITNDMILLFEKN